MLNEAETRAKLIDPKLHESGWSEDLIQREEKITEGRIFRPLRNRKSVHERWEEKIDFQEVKFQTLKNRAPVNKHIGNSKPKFEEGEFEQ